MRPRLFEIHLPGTQVAIPIFAYGFMIMIGFLVGIYLARVRARRVGISPDAIIDMGLVMLVCGIFGARLLHVIQYYDPHYVSSDGSPAFARMLQIWHGGLVFYGGLIAAVAGGGVFLRCKKLALGRMLDVAAPSAILGLAFGRVGCFLNGCCWGCEADPHRVPWAVVFPPDALAYQGKVPLSTPALHPTQVYNALAALLLFVILNFYFERRRRDGEVALLLCLLYPVTRFITEFFRGDTGVESGLTKSQWMGIFVFIPALVLFVWLRTRPIPAQPVTAPTSEKDGRSPESNKQRVRERKRPRQKKQD